jgi:hypothetical protein
MKGVKGVGCVKLVIRRSPMLEDKDREVFSVNLTWPQSQRDRYKAHLKMEAEKQRKIEAKLKVLGGNA